MTADGGYEAVRNPQDAVPLMRRLLVEASIIVGSVAFVVAGTTAVVLALAAAGWLR